MPIEDWKDFVSVTATISTVVNFLTGLQVIRGHSRKGTTGETSGLPFIAGALNCSVWLKYGLLINDTPMTYVNTIGATLLTSYAFFFYMYSPYRTSVLKQIIFAMGFFCTICFYVDGMDESLGHARYCLGLVGSFLAVSFYASPLASLPHVIRTKSSDVLPFPIILTSFIVSGQWWLYGIILNDNFVKVPNCIGCCFASFLLFLFWFYPANSNRKNSLPISTKDTKPLLS